MSASADKQAVKPFEGRLMMAAGGLITLLCGSCTVLLMGSGIQGTIALKHRETLTDEQRYDAAYGQVFGVASIVVGGLPTALGVVLFVNGLRAVRRAGPPQDPTDTGAKS